MKYLIIAVIVGLFVVTFTTDNSNMSVACAFLGMIAIPCCPAACHLLEELKEESEEVDLWQEMDDYYTVVRARVIPHKCGHEDVVECTLSEVFDGLSTDCESCLALQERGME